MGSRQRGGWNLLEEAAELCVKHDPLVPLFFVAAFCARYLDLWRSFACTVSRDWPTRKRTAQSEGFLIFWLYHLDVQSLYEINYIFTERDGRKGPPAGNKARCNRTNTPHSKSEINHIINHSCSKTCIFAARQSSNYRAAGYRCLALLSPTPSASTTLSEQHGPKVRACKSTVHHSNK
jgi:hypothetical protein